MNQEFSGAWEDPCSIFFEILSIENFCNKVLK